MVVTSIGHIFQNDFVTFDNEAFGERTLGKVISFFQKVSVIT
jgi:hypothetical protein